MTEEPISADIITLLKTWRCHSSFNCNYLFSASINRDGGLCVNMEETLVRCINICKYNVVGLNLHNLLFPESTKVLRGVFFKKKYLYFAVLLTHRPSRSPGNLLQMGC